MEGSELARALVKHRWGAVEARQRVHGKWTGDNNPNAFLTVEQKNVLRKAGLRALGPYSSLLRRLEDHAKNAEPKKRLEP